MTSWNKARPVISITGLLLYMLFIHNKINNDNEKDNNVHSYKNNNLLFRWYRQ